MSELSRVGVGTEGVGFNMELEEAERARTGVRRSPWPSLARP